MTIHAIPTTYKGINYRSRLEARFASLFDSLGWGFEYEPCLELKHYIADFLVGDLLVECKPNDGQGWEEEAVDKIRASGWKGRAVILGSTLEKNSLGALSPGMAMAEDECWWRVFFVRCDPCGFSLSWNGTCMRCTGEDVTDLTVGEQGHIVTCWKRAGNDTQWLPKA